MKIFDKLKKSLFQNENSKWSGGVMGVAGFEILPIRKENELSVLPIKYHFPVGHTQKISNSSSLVKPFKKLLEDGKPIGKISFLFYEDARKYYTIGSIVNTTKRLIFFPGLTSTKVIESPPDKHKIQNIALHIDHLTLEENWKDWHFTFTEKENEKKFTVQQRKTKLIKDDLHLWFVMLVQDLSKLEIMPNSQEFLLKTSVDKEIDRRFAEFVETRNGSEFPVMKVGGNPEGKWYLNIEFFVDKKKSKNYRKDYPQTPTVYNANYLSDFQGKIIKGLHSRTHHVHLPNFSGRIWIRISKMPGNLKTEGYFIPGSDFK